MIQVAGIEPALSVWKTEILPLYDTCCAWAGGPSPSYYLPPTEDTLSVSRPMDTLSATRGHYFSIC
jgi:hypothetical protein